MDNFELKVVSEGKDTLLLAMRLAFIEYEKASHWRVDDEKGMILYWSVSDSPFTGKEQIKPFITPLNAEQITEQVWLWLEGADIEKYDGPEPDHDGSNGRGFCLYTEEWGKIGDEDYAFVAIKPTWAMYGK